MNKQSDFDIYYNGVRLTRIGEYPKWGHGNDPFLRPAEPADAEEIKD